MINFHRHLSFILPLLFGFLDIYSQTQSDFLDNLSDKFTEYCRQFPREEIYVHTDRSEYIAGENMWFKVYLFDRQTSRLSSESSIAYFEILNPENRPVLRKRIRLDNGSGPGQVALPDTISSGDYTIRTYTNWMRNFMPDNCFSKKILIHNALNGKTFSNLIPVTNGTTSLQESSMSSLQKQGLNIDINRNQPAIIEIILTTNRDFRSVNRNICYLFIQTHGIINDKRVVKLQGDTTRIKIPGNQIIPGINHVAIFSYSGRPVHQIYTYTPVKSVKPMVITSEERYKPRDKMGLGIEFIPYESLSPELQADLSISVAPAGQSSFPDIADYMIFGSEFGNIAEEILKKVIDNIPDGDLLKLPGGLKSNWIDWNIILGGKYPAIKYEREYDYHFLYGRLQNRNSQVPDKDQYVFLSIPGKSAVFQYAKTDENGDFCFSLKPDAGIMDLIIQPEEVDRENTIRIETSFSEKYPLIANALEMPAEKITDNISRLAVNYQVMKIYQSEEVPEDSLPSVFISRSKRFYGKPDIELVMDDYIKLPVMYEIFFELMPGVIMKKEKSGYEITIADPVDNRIFPKPPVLFIDGVVVRDPDIIAELDPELVEKIDALRTRYFVGDYMFYGLVNIITRTGDFNDILLPDYAIRLPYRVTEASESFTYNDYSSPEEKQNRIPDFRNTLYWSPSIPQGENGKLSVDFWASDFRSDYEISIQGILPDGTLISSKKIIKIN